MSRLTKTLGAAVVVHAIAWALTAPRAVGPRASVVAPPREMEVAIDVTEPVRAVEPRAAEPPALPTNETRVAPAVRAEATNRGTEGLARGVGGEVESAPSPAPNASASAGSGAWTLSPLAAPSVDLGLGASGKYAAAGPAGAEGGDGANRRAATSLDDGHDVAVGLARGGAAISAAIDETRASRAPVDGWAVLDVVSNAVGHVVEVQVVDVSEDWDAWKEVAERMVTALAARPFRVPARSRGLVTRIRVLSKWQYPDGRSARGSKPPPVVRALTMPLEVVLGGDPTENERAVRFVTASVQSETPIPL
jgi:hypothetical protein